MANTVTPDGARIRRLRIQRGWTQEQLAGIAGVSTRSIQRTECGSATSLETLRALASGFSIEVSDLLPVEAAADPPGKPSQETMGERRKERVLIPPPVAEPSRLRPGAECRHLPVRRTGFRFSTAPEIAVLTMSIVALVAGVAFVGEDWSGRYTPGIEPAQGPTPATAVAAAPADADRTQLNPRTQGVEWSAATAFPSAQATRDTPRPHQDRSADEVTALVQSPPAVIVENSQAAVAWSAPTSRAPEVEGAVVLLAEARSGLDPIGMQLRNARSATLKASRADDESDSGVFRIALREAGRKTGGFLARAGSSVTASMKAAF